MRSKNEPTIIEMTRTQKARRQDILDATIAVINRDGYANASIQKIADEAGTSKGTVLYHFKSRVAIDKAVVGSIFEDGAAYMAPFILRAATSRERLKAYITSNLQFIADHVEAIAALHEIERSVGRARFGSSSDLMQDDAPIVWLSGMLGAGQNAGELGTFDPAVLAASVRLVIDGSSHYILTHPSLNVGQYISEIVRLFDAAVAPKAQKGPRP